MPLVLSGLYLIGSLFIPGGGKAVEEGGAALLREVGVQGIKELADKIPNLYLLGRLAEYKYYDMDDVVEKALQLVEEL